MIHTTHCEAKLNHLLAQHISLDPHSNHELYKLNSIFMENRSANSEVIRHMVRVGYMSHCIADLIGMDPKFCDLLFYAAAYHDIGKIGVEGRILSKMSTLTDVEWIQMKLHPVVGKNIFGFGSSDLVTMCKEVSYSHHERWDGSGYPARIKGENIPISARIVAIADVMDALLSKRSYKDSWSVSEVSEYILREAGLAFDPSISDMVIDNFIEIVQVREMAEVIT